MGSVDWSLITHINFLELARRFPHGKRGLKSIAEDLWFSELVSLPSWEAWIEVHGPAKKLPDHKVASLMGSVDWSYKCCVQLLTRSGRFPHGKRGLKFLYRDKLPKFNNVASLMGSVDWSNSSLNNKNWKKESLPSWEAWIEVTSAAYSYLREVVASLMGSVDWSRCYFVFCL